MTFELITTILNILAIVGLIGVTLIAIQHKIRIEKAQEDLNKHLDHILEVIETSKVRSKPKKGTSK